MPSFCVTCGKPMGPGARFCLACGAETSSAPVAIPHQPPTAIPEQPPISVSGAQVEGRMSNFCTSCGKPLQPAMNFCMYCGAAVATAPASHSAPAVAAMQSPVSYLPSSIVANLAKYRRHELALCPKCGYSGSVGCIGKKYPMGRWAWVVGIPFFATLIGMIILAWQFIFQKWLLECPNCKAQFSKQMTLMEGLNPFN